MIAKKVWKWIPGKEALNMLLEIDNSFWEKLTKLLEKKENTLSDLIRDSEIKSFLDTLNQPNSSG